MLNESSISVMNEVTVSTFADDACGSMYMAWVFSPSTGN